MLNLDQLRGRAVVRDPDEEHRTATALELFFDLTFVVAVGRASGALHHELIAGHVGDGVTGFVLLFFGVWWAWMNFTWFASAHDSDDVVYRLLVFVQITGALVFASGVTRAIEEGWLVVGVIGYLIMRVGQILGWLRVARDQPDVRSRALRYAGLTAGVQVLWLSGLALPSEWQRWAFIVLVCCELAIPVIGERAAPRPLFHPEHIAERYGLFTLIVLGETILSAAIGFQDAVDAGGLSLELLVLGISALIVAFAAWWLYFDHPGHLAPTPEVSFRWGYAHVGVFAALAAAGAGVHVAAESFGEDGHGEERVAALALALPVVAYLLGLALIMALTGKSSPDSRIWPKVVGAGTVLAIGLAASVPVTAVGCAVVMVLLAASMVLTSTPRRSPTLVSSG